MNCEKYNRQHNKTLMVQGTTSDAGKSTLVAALCRIYVNQGIKIAPFKPQNMALNSAVTKCGGEIGRAQAVQAQAANVDAEIDFNPVLLKPQSDTAAQVIIQGKALPAMEAADYHHYKQTAAKAVFDSHRKLTNRFDRIIVEGAGSPAEINLRQGDIANMGFAEEADCPVILIADIDKGGVFAHLVGTLALLSQSEQDRVIGFVINRFRGDIGLLQSGLDWLEQQTNKPVLGVLPYIHGLTIASEDAVDIEQDTTQTKLKVIVPVYPRMSNHTDFDALRTHPEIELTFVFASELGQTPLPPADLIILPGSKSVIADLAFLREQGWDNDIARHLRYGGKVFGICGGYQMLGAFINDPLQIEGQQKQAQGLGYIPTQTELKADKTLVNVSGLLQLAEGQAAFAGYEIHAGVTTELSIEHVSCDTSSIIEIAGKNSGHQSADGQVAGCYIHGLFDRDDCIKTLASWCEVKLNSQLDLVAQQEMAIDKLAEVCAEHLNLEQIETLLTQWRAP